MKQWYVQIRNLINQVARKVLFIKRLQYQKNTTKKVTNWRERRKQETDKDNSMDARYYNYYKVRAITTRYRDID